MKDRAPSKKSFISYENYFQLRLWMSKVVKKILAKMKLQEMKMNNELGIKKFIIATLHFYNKKLINSYVPHFQYSILFLWFN